MLFDSGRCAYINARKLFDSLPQRRSLALISLVRLGKTFLPMNNRFQTSRAGNSATV